MLYVHHLFGEMIQFDLRICFKWVGEKPPTIVSDALFFLEIGMACINPTPEKKKHAQRFFFSVENALVTTRHQFSTVVLLPLEIFGISIGLKIIPPWDEMTWCFFWNPSRKLSNPRHFNVKDPCEWQKSWLFAVYRGWNTTQLYRDCFISHEIRIPSWTNQDSMVHVIRVRFTLPTWFSWMGDLYGRFFFKLKRSKMGVLSWES